VTAAWSNQGLNIGPSASEIAVFKFQATYSDAKQNLLPHIQSKKCRAALS
jgi:hypothetical protein